MAKRLTEPTIIKLQPKKSGSYTIWDTVATGLGLKVTPTGKKIWRLQMRYPGHQHQTKRTLGHFHPDDPDTMGVEEARKKANEWRGLRARDIDPKEHEAKKAEEIVEKKRQQALQDAKTFTSVAEKYIAEHVTGQRREQKAKLEIRSLLISELGDRPIHSITPADIRELVAKISNAAPYQGRTAFGHARTLFTWAVHQDIVSASPVASLKAKWVLSKKIKLRERVLSDAEIAAFWRAADQMGNYGKYVQLLLLTGVRREQLAEAEWGEFDLQAGKWVIPRDRKGSKSATTRTLPLTDDAVTILKSVPNNGRRVFKPFQQDPRKKELDEYMLAELKKDKIERWVLHDLRRTLRTGLAALEVPENVAEMAIDHAKKGMARIYDQHRYEPQIRDALTKWALRLREITNPTPPASDNVVKLKRKAR
jgi:integrase